MSRAAAPAVRAALILAALFVCAARVRAADLPNCTQEIHRCLAACRAVCARRLSEHERRMKSPIRSLEGAGAHDRRAQR